jgi:thiol-disulfide isomerase/thioredoxin
MKKTFLLGAALLAAFILCLPESRADSPRTKPVQPERIAHGQEVNIRDYLVPGKTVVFDFTSEFCPPCRAIAPHLHKLHAERDDVVVVEVDINRPGVQGIDWGSPVATQYGLNSIPHFKVFSPDGQLQAEGKEARALVTSWFR